MILTLLTLLLLTALFTNTHAGLYRWVDSQGNVHYTDSIPPEAAGKGADKYNQQGVRINKIERSLTPEEIEEQRERQQARLEAQREHQKRVNKDRALLAAYRSEGDILRARDANIMKIMTRDTVVNGNIYRARKELTHTPGTDSSEFREVLDRIYDNYRTLFRFSNERKRIREENAELISRFRLVRDRGLGAREDTSVTAMNINEMLDPTHLVCPDQQSCQQWWQQVSLYLGEHSDTNQLIGNDTLLLTYLPKSATEISLSAAFLEEQDGQPAQILLDVTCYPGAEGTATCESARATAIRDRFRAAITAAGTTP